MPNLKDVYLNSNPLGDQGVTALVAPLRKLLVIRDLYLNTCCIGDEGVASLVDNLGKDDFKQLEGLWLSDNKITDVGMAALAKSFETGGLPKLACDDWSVRGFFRRNPRASASAVQAARDALTKRSQ